MKCVYSTRQNRGEPCQERRKSLSGGEGVSHYEAEAVEHTSFWTSVCLSLANNQNSTHMHAQTHRHTDTDTTFEN
eukprot:3932618-Amphidinium_carterae.1